MARLIHGSKLAKIKASDSSWTRKQDMRMCVKKGAIFKNHNCFENATKSKQKIGTIIPSFLNSEFLMGIVVFMGVAAMEELYCIPQEAYNSHKHHNNAHGCLEKKRKWLWCVFFNVFFCCYLRTIPAVLRNSLKMT